MHVMLKILQGSKQGKEVKIPTPKCLIGRGEDCHLRPQSEAISRRHCVILTTENEVVVRDLSSRNGTFVNDEQVKEEAVLLHGDVLRVGPLQFEIDIKEAVARTAEGSGINSTSDLGDVTQWLDEADSAEKSRRTAPETRQFRLDETVVPSDSDVQPEAAAAAASGAGSATMKRPEKSQPGKLPPRPTTNKADSREAAADMLKKFFNRR
jgi:predicted component of type VI protein secretion system